MRSTSDSSRGWFWQNRKAAQLVSGLFLCASALSSLSSKIGLGLTPGNQLTHKNLTPCPQPRMQNPADSVHNLHGQNVAHSCDKLRNGMKNWHHGVTGLGELSLKKLKAAVIDW